MLNRNKLISTAGYSYSANTLWLTAWKQTRRFFIGPKIDFFFQAVHIFVYFALLLSLVALAIVWYWTEQFVILSMCSHERFSENSAGIYSYIYLLKWAVFFSMRENIPSDIKQTMSSELLLCICQPCKKRHFSTEQKNIQMNRNANEKNIPLL